MKQHHTAFITEPLTIDYMKKIRDKNNFIQRNVLVELNEIIDSDLEGFLDILSEKLTGSCLLMSTSYELADLYDKNTVIITVTGDISMILETEGGENT
jgi:energy-converting hydrogenase A subunit M